MRFFIFLGKSPSWWRLWEDTISPFLFTLGFKLSCAGQPLLLLQAEAIKKIQKQNIAEKVKKRACFFMI
jgi:hypothetical protein